jgi:hypothetical protein
MAFMLHCVLRRKSTDEKFGSLLECTLKSISREVRSACPWGRCRERSFRLGSSLKTNTVKTRTMSLLNQGLAWYESLNHGNLQQERAELLLSPYEKILREHHCSDKSCASTHRCARGKRGDGSAVARETAL